MSKEKTARYTQGPIEQTMLKTALAMLAGTLAMSGYNIVDTYFVGQLGKIPMAAMGFTFPVIMIVNCIFFGLAAGTMTTMAQALGSGNQLRAKRLVTSGLELLVVISILLALLGIRINPWVFDHMGATPEALPLTLEYMNIWYFGCVTSSLALAGNKLLVGTGDSNVAAAMMMAGLVINTILDPFFIFGWCGLPEMGIRGAALATVLSQFISTILLLLLLRIRHQLIEFKVYSLRVLLPLWKLVMRYAIPAAIGMLMMPIASFVITWITAQFGNAAVAAVAAAGRLESIAFIFPMALGIPMLSMVGQNYGARLYSRIRKCFRFAMSFAFVYLMLMAILFFLFSRYLIQFFAPDQDVQEIMKLCLMIVPWGFATVEIHRYSGFFYTGCDRPAFSAWLNIFRIAGLLLPLAFLALHFNSLEGLFFARLAADGTAGIIGFLLSWRMVHRLPRQDGEEEIRKKGRRSAPQTH